jgi:hypothetical protein
MDWLSKFADKRAQKHRDETLVDSAAAEFWASLKDQLRAARDAYTRLYPPDDVQMQVQYNEVNAHHSVLKRMTLDQADFPAFKVEKDSVSIEFHARATITAVYSTQTPPRILYVNRSEEGQAVVEYSEESVSLDRACELILAPILFDDLS